STRDRVKKKTASEKTPRKKNQNLSSLLKENNQLKKELRQKAKELSYFINVGKALTSTLEFKKVLRVIMETAQRMTRCQSWSLLLLEEQKEELYCELAKGISLRSVKEVRYKMGDGPVGSVAETGLPLLIPDFSNQKQFRRSE